MCDPVLTLLVSIWRDLFAFHFFFVLVCPLAGCVRACVLTCVLVDLFTGARITLVAAAARGFVACRPFGTPRQTPARLAGLHDIPGEATGSLAHFA